MSGARIRLDGVTKRFGDGPEVLSGCDLTVEPGAFLAIVGKSGSGKSTLLRLIQGLDQPSTGKLTVDGGPIRMMFQEPRLLPWRRVRENVAVGLGPGARDAPARAGAALAEVGLGDRGDAWPAQLSGGQRQRVALARALVSGPALLALDEPLGALDALTRIEMQGLLERIWREQGFTAVLVTHDVSEAVALGDRIILIEDGRIGLDLAVDLPRPRRRGDPAFGALEGRVLDRLLERVVPSEPASFLGKG
jgi:sulfonate transport system ATP-binding protein